MLMSPHQLLKQAPVTLLFIISFVVVMAIQVMNGVNIDEQTGEQLIRYGANFLPLTLGHEPWRLLSAGFLHIGIIHLLFNSFAMYYFGVVSEQILGRWRFLVVFLCSVVAGNLFNLFVTLRRLEQHGIEQGVGLSAGASGGIMGLGMLLLTLAVFGAGRGEYRLNVKNLAWVMGINFIMTFAVPSIDVAGHIGGMMMGVLLGLCHVADHRFMRIKGVFITGAGVASFAMVWLWQQMHHQMLF